MSRLYPIAKTFLNYLFLDHEYFCILKYHILFQYGIIPHDGDHHSDGSAETIGSDSGRGCSEEDDVFSTPSAGKLFHQFCTQFYCFFLNI